MPAMHMDIYPQLRYGDFPSRLPAQCAENSDCRLLKKTQMRAGPWCSCPWKRSRIPNEHVHAIRAIGSAPVDEQDNRHMRLFQRPTNRESRRIPWPTTVLWLRFLRRIVSPLSAPAIAIITQSTFSRICRTWGSTLLGSCRSIRGGRKFSD